MSKYQSLNHAKYLIKYHLIFSTKYRRNILNPIKDDIKRYMELACTKDFQIECQEIDSNHIHLLISSTPNISPSEIVSQLKQKSVYMVWQEHYDYMRKYYWSGKHYLWTRGYFVCSIGDANAETIRNYIENQG